MKKFFIVLFILFLIGIITAGFMAYSARKAIISAIETNLLESAEKATGKNIDISQISYAFPQGIVLSNITIYDHGKPRASGMYIKEIFLKPNIVQSFFSRQLLFTVIIKSFTWNDKSVSGTITLRSSHIKNWRKPFENIKIESIIFSNTSISLKNLTMSDMSGDLSITDKVAYSSDMSFFINGREHFASFSLKFHERFYLTITGPLLKTTILIEKDKEQYHIIDSKINWLSSTIDIDGVVTDLKDPYLSLGIRTNISLLDLSEINTSLKNFVAMLDINGNVQSVLSFDGILRKPDTWKIHGDFSSSSVKIHKFSFNDFMFTLSFIDNMLTLPQIKANTYDGLTTMYFKANLGETYLPFVFTVSGENISLNKMIRDLTQRSSRVFGDLFFNLELQGDLTNTKSLEGSAAIVINNADLGLMPIFAPMLKDVHEFLTKTVQTLEQITITGAECNIMIKNEKVSTNNLWFWGNILNVYAKGYIGFNKDIYFEVTNEIKEISPEEQEDWQKDLVRFMANIGKVLGKAYVSGTLDKYEWKFDFFGGWKDNIARNIQKFISNIMNE
ncbi:MAG: hypothetical protein PHQ52_00375 [Candidatus Omnitrophica bacterium]|nr:hypothetical protein [Candidatus Omnitrophota bacterium]